jgi:lambda family phage portal protein
MTWVDRSIGWLSPARGLRRAQARKMMEALAYEGARSGRRTQGWVTTSLDSDGESQSVVGDLRNRARDLVRNNSYAAAAVDVKVTETIGAGIVAEVQNKRLATMWDAFVENCDADGNLDLYGVQALIERCRMESGECLVRFMDDTSVTESQIRAGRVPLQLRVLEPDYLDASRDGRSPNGNFIRYGIEYNPAGGVVGYWIFNEHPGGASTSILRAAGLTSEFVPASDVLHVFRRLRAGQTRGVTDFAPAMLRMRDLDDYDDAEVMRKKIEACLAAFVTTPEGAGASPLGPVTTDTEGRIEQLYPAMVEYLKPGESVMFTEPKSSGGYADFERFSLRAIAAGTGIPYELMTGDLSQVNYSSYRAGLIRFRRRLEQDQKHVHIRGVCRPVWNRFLDAASVQFKRPPAAKSSVAAWTPPRFELIDPKKETEAEVEAVLAGFDTWAQVVRRRGWTSSGQLDEIEKWQKELDARGIVLKSDHRTSMSQPAAPAEPPAPPDDDEEENAA